jgi:hypothetical protein
MAVITVKVIAETPRFGQGEMDANPSPDPRASRINEAAAATNEPAMIAGQDAADAAADSARLQGRCTVGVRLHDGFHRRLSRLAMRTHGEQQDDWERNA